MIANRGWINLGPAIFWKIIWARRNPKHTTDDWSNGTARKLTGTGGSPTPLGAAAGGRGIRQRRRDHGAGWGGFGGGKRSAPAGRRRAGERRKFGCSLTTGPDAAEVAHGKIRAVQNYLTSRISQLPICLTTGDKNGANIFYRKVKYEFNLSLPGMVVWFSPLKRKRVMWWHDYETSTRFFSIYKAYFLWFMYDAREQNMHVHGVHFSIVVKYMRKHH